METFIAGQRWISNTESELGLGLIVESSFNRVSVLFLACDEKRIYAADNAPLTRVKFSIGDNIESVDDEKLTVLKITENAGILTYICKNEDGATVELEEMDLSHHSQFNKPQDRLFTGQTDPNAWFSLRYETWQRLQQHAKSPVKGLIGVRAALIPHQIFIAHEAANRAAPRIMLADEVGLGKTIEAGLIIHHRLINNLSKRILIIVPESLLHQWLVEMLRRFNLKFSIFDEMRCLSEIGDDGFDDDEKGDLYNQANPFLSEQLVLCSQSFFSHYPNRQEQALDAGWDMVIVDEAHHLEWSETAPSSDYLFVEQLSQISPSLILLTATPEQLGKESHFARLRLLDPDRFYSFAAFLEEEKTFEPVANAAKSLLADKPLTNEEQQALATLLKDDNVSKTLANLNDAEKSAAARQTLINILLDHHGTGRILFRNSRQTVQGFPEREYFGYSLNGEANETDLQNDARFLWLAEKVKQLAGQKALLICKHAQTAMDLEDTLKMKVGISSAVFHEHMTIIERDRAAAYFADEESSARLLICSEIGSEGRNFQFLQHLILWDLPQNPDLLQQRIGRLDRIGQKHVIQIHVPYLENTEQAILYRWYDEGLNAFRANNSAAQHVADALHDELQTLLANNDAKKIGEFIEKTHALSVQIEAELNHGRDQLLELNSCRKEIADNYITELSEYENEGTLWDYMESVFDCYGVDTEEISDVTHILTPSEHLRCETFPYLTHEDDLTVTVSRAQALAREELQFLTWEHPLVSASMDMVISSDTGNATLSSVKNPDLKAGQFLLECLFVVEHSAPAELQINRFLPPTPIRVLINQLQKDVTAEFSHESLPDCGANFDKHAITVFLNKQRNLIMKLLAVSETQAQIQKEAICQQATTTMLESLTAEIKRLARLQKVNPSIKNDEIEDLKDKTLLIHENIEIAQLRLDAVRFVITR
ncbi:MAG: RNA polymerase-associated protein RapA [Methylococcales bacterium]|nr:RNA polymerase-associated protein RapA [Methylococcales bacterium]